MKRFLGISLAAFIALTFAVATPSDASAQCANCQTCLGGHKAPSGSGNDLGSVHSVCLQNPYCTGHPPCGVGLIEIDQARQELLEKLVDDANAGDFVAVLTMLRTFHKQASINEERSALQVATLSTCEDQAGRLIAHVPLEAAQIAIAAEWRDEGIAARSAVAVQQ